MRLWIFLIIGLFGLNSLALSLDWQLDLDAYYLYNLNSPPNTSGSLAPNGQRAYDNAHNSMQLNLAQMAFRVKKGNNTLVTEFGYGAMADIINGTSDARNLNQLYLEVKPNALPDWKFLVGKMYSHMGLEGVMAKDNWNYSRNLIHAVGTPTWHVGVAIIPPARDVLNFAAYIYNGSDAIGGTSTNKTFHDNNSSKTLGGRVQVTPMDELNIAYNLLIGPEDTDNNSDNTVIHNVTAVWGLNDKIKLAGELLIGSAEDQGTAGKDAEWTAFAGYFKYQAGADWYMAARLENFDDKEGNVIEAGKPEQKVTSTTFTWGKDMGDGLETRAELRLDKSNYDAAYLDSDGSGTDDQMSFGLAMLYVM